MLFASHSSSFDRAFRAAFGHGQRLRAAHELGNYVVAGHTRTLRYNPRSEAADRSVLFQPHASAPRMADVKDLHHVTCNREQDSIHVRSPTVKQLTNFDR